MPTIVDSKPSPEFRTIGLASVYNRNGASFSGDELADERLAEKNLSLTGENVINFHPYGDAGLPVSGKAMLAIQAFPLGCAKSSGRLLAVCSDNPRLTLHYANRFLIQNRMMIQLAQEAGSKKMPEPDYRQFTLLIDTLLDQEG